jgi:ribosomal protein S18 acetylase RimI-like enzyme
MSNPAMLLRLAQPEDAAWVWGLYMHPLVNPFLLYEQMPFEQFQPIYAALLAAQCKYVLMRGEQRAGMCKLLRMQHRDAHRIYIGGLAVAPECAGQGMGDALMVAIIARCEQLDAKRLELSVSDSNTRAIRLYERHGFVVEGLMRQFTYLRAENRYLDEVLMARVR